MDDEASLREHVGPLGDVQGKGHVLFDDEHARTEGVGGRAQHRQQPLDHDRRQAEAHLVDDQHARLRDQRATDGEHLLLATGQQPGLAAEALAQLGQQVEHLVVAGDVTAARDAQVLVGGQVVEQRAIFGHQREAAAGDPVGRLATDLARRRT